METCNEIWSCDMFQVLSTIADHFQEKKKRSWEIASVVSMLVTICSLKWKWDYKLW